VAHSEKPAIADLQKLLKYFISSRAHTHKNINLKHNNLKFAFISLSPPSSQPTQPSAFPTPSLANHMHTNNNEKS
jgi:hypothetical protein